MSKISSAEQVDLREGLRALLILDAFEKRYGRPPRYPDSKIGNILTCLWFKLKGKKYYGKLQAFQDGWDAYEEWIKKLNGVE